ncbi:MAG: hypothetical protein CM15mP103_03790 [Gammaproteobacteria bacterium]|nr:MAG: hypothetical protein CM15mP103_03790 [Gammaproteobacteria bacterium]
MVRREGKIAEVRQNPFNGYISELQLSDGAVIDGDFFIDCTGFRGLLIEQTLSAGYDDWTHWLPSDRAVAVQTEMWVRPYPTRVPLPAKRVGNGGFPLQHRVGNGLVFSSKFWSEDEATEQLLSNVQGARITDPRVIRFQTGTRRAHWKKNCVAMGLSSGFMEPLGPPVST